MIRYKCVASQVTSGSYMCKCIDNQLSKMTLIIIVVVVDNTITQRREKQN